MSYRPDAETSLGRYAQAWNTDDADDRWALVHACCAPEVTLLAPALDKPVESQAAVAAFLGLPRPTDAAFEVTRPDTHHRWLRALWRQGDDQGLLVARLDGDGRLAEIVHFVD